MEVSSEDGEKGKTQEVFLDGWDFGYGDMSAMACVWFEAGC